MEGLPLVLVKSVEHLDVSKIDLGNRDTKTTYNNGNGSDRTSDLTVNSFYSICF